MFLNMTNESTENLLETVTTNNADYITIISDTARVDLRMNIIIPLAFISNRFANTSKTDMFLLFPCQWAVRLHIVLRNHALIRRKS